MATFVYRVAGWLRKGATASSGSGGYGETPYGAAPYGD